MKNGDRRLNSEVHKTTDIALVAFLMCKGASSPNLERQSDSDIVIFHVKLNRELKDEIAKWNTDRAICNPRKFYAYLQNLKREIFNETNKNKNR